MQTACDRTTIVNCLLAVLPLKATTSTMKHNLRNVNVTAGLKRFLLR